jgi:hypothetical protein
MATEQICLVNGCSATKKYYKNLCSRHYQQSRAGKTIEMMEAEEEVVAIPKPPKPPSDKKRCSAMVNGKRCIRGIRARGLCAAHWHEQEDRQAFELREQPLDSKRRDYEGNEAALIAMQERADVR